MKKNWFLYIIECESKKLYTGITTDIERRFNEHLKVKHLKAKFFRYETPKSVVYSEKFNNRSLASKREYAIKKMSRKKKLALIIKK